MDFASNGVAATGDAVAAALETAAAGELPEAAALPVLVLKLAFWTDGPLPPPALPKDGPLPDGALNDGALPEPALNDGPLPPNEAPLPPKDAAGDTVGEKPPGAPCCW